MTTSQRASTASGHSRMPEAGRASGTGHACRNVRATVAPTRPPMTSSTLAVARRRTTGTPPSHDRLNRRAPFRERRASPRVWPAQRGQRADGDRQQPSSDMACTAATRPPVSGMTCTRPCRYFSASSGGRMVTSKAGPSTTQMAKCGQHPARDRCDRRRREPIQRVTKGPPRSQASAPKHAPAV